MMLQRLFGKKEDSDKKQKKVNRATRVAGLSVLGYGIYNTNSNKKRAKQVSSNREDTELLNRIKNKSKSLNVEIHEVDNYSNASAFDSEKLKKAKNKIDKNPNSNKSRRTRDILKSKGLDINNVDLSKKHITVGKKIESPEIVAHELGHISNKTDKNLAYRLSQKSSGFGKKLSAGGSLVSLGTGISDGIKEAKTGEKSNNKASRYAGDALVLAGSIPVLAAECAASKKGYKILKELGANKRQLKEAKKSLIRNGSTYVAQTGKKVIVSEASRFAGEKLGKSAYKGYKKLKDRSDDNN